MLAREPSSTYLEHWPNVLQVVEGSGLLLCAALQAVHFKAPPRAAWVMEINQC